MMMNNLIKIANVARECMIQAIEKITQECTIT